MDFEQKNPSKECGSYPITGRILWWFSNYDPFCGDTKAQHETGMGTNKRSMPIVDVLTTAGFRIL